MISRDPEPSLPQDATAGRPRVAFISPSGRSLPVVARVLRSTGAPFEVHDVLSAALSAPPADLLIIDLEGTSEAQLQEIQLATESGAVGCRLLFVAQDVDLSTIAALMKRKILTNVIAGDLGDRGDAAEDLRITVQKVLRNEIFGVEKYFGWGLQLRRFTIERASARGELLGEAEQFAQYVGAHARVSATFRTVVDELVTNALYNAPVSESGSARHRHLPRSEDVVLRPDEHVEVILASDGRRLAVSTVDPFGSMPEALLLERLGRNLKPQLRQIDSSSGGAGLGLSFIFDSLHQMVVNLRPGAKTEIIGLIHTEGTYRHFLQRKKSFNLFVDRSP